MSTGKRLAKRSILGTRVCAPNSQGLFVPGVIQGYEPRSSTYSVCLDEDKGVREYRQSELVGSGFRSVSDLAALRSGQRVFVTHNGREVRGSVLEHRPETDEIDLSLPGGLVLRKRIDEVRLIESRKSARLLDTDTDYSRLADGQPEPRRRASSLSIDVPYGQSGRKRRSSADDGVMDDCMAAMVLMSLSCSPKSPCLPINSWSALASSSGASSCGGSTRATPSPPMMMDAQTDEGIDSDASSSFTADDAFPPPKRKSPSRTRVVFQCTWPGCGQQYNECYLVERHVRTQHLKRSDDESEGSDHEEEFYYTEMEVESGPFLQGSIYSSSVPTLSHLDMARPAHEDPEYKKQHALVMNTPFSQASPISIPQLQKSAAWHLHGYAASAPSNMGSPQKCMRLSVKSTSSPSKASSPLHRRTRSESRKCRKVYGMENRDMWCTQCKWKKACTRFTD